MVYPFHATDGRSHVSRCWVLAVVLITTVVTAHAEALTFQRALAIAVSEAPDLRLNEARVDAARDFVVPAGELPDPRLVLGIDNLPAQGSDRYKFDRDPMTMQRIGLMQDIPNATKREARIEAAVGRVELAKAQSRIDHLAVLRETASAWIARYMVERQLARIDALVVENRLLADTVRGQIAGNGGSATDAILPRQEAALIEERRDELMARREQAIATLKRWVGPVGDMPLVGDPPDWPLRRETLEHALHQHPELAIFEPRAKVLDAKIAEARAGKRPDWGVDVAYQKRAPEFGDMVSVQLRFDLPVFSGSRQDPTIAAREAERTALDAERESVRREHLAMLDADWADYRRLRNAVKRQREIMLPLAEEKVRLATAAWRGGKGQVADVIAARRERIETELKTIAVEGERWRMAARLYYAYGDLSGEDDESYQ